MGDHREHIKSGIMLTKSPLSGDRNTSEITPGVPQTQSTHGMYSRNSVHFNIRPQTSPTDIGTGVTQTQQNPSVDHTHSRKAHTHRSTGLCKLRINLDQPCQATTTSRATPNPGDIYTSPSGTVLDTRPHVSQLYPSQSTSGIQNRY